MKTHIQQTLTQLHNAEWASSNMALFTLKLVNSFLKDDHQTHSRTEAESDHLRQFNRAFALAAKERKKRTAEEAIAQAILQKSKEAEYLKLAKDAQSTITNAQRWKVALFDDDDSMKGDPSSGADEIILILDEEIQIKRLKVDIDAHLLILRGNPCKSCINP